jgi:hypothetical protein
MSEPNETAVSETNLPDLEDKHEFRPRDRKLLACVLTPPAAVLANLTLNYALVPTACANGTKGLLHIVTLGFTVICAVTGLLSWRYHEEFSRPANELWQERTRWVAMIGVVLAIFSVMVLVAMEIPNIVLRSCD